MSSSSFAGTLGSTGTDGTSPLPAGAVGGVLGATSPKGDDPAGAGATADAALGAAADDSEVSSVTDGGNDGSAVVSLVVAGAAGELSPLAGATVVGAAGGVAATTTGAEAPAAGVTDAVGSDGNATSLAEGNGTLTVVTGPSERPIESHNAAIAATPRAPVATAAMAVWRRRGRTRIGAGGSALPPVSGAVSGPVSRDG